VRTPVFNPSVDKLVEARVLVMRRSPRAGDLLCECSFVEGLRVDSLTRDGRRILYDADYVKATPVAELAVKLEAIAGRAIKMRGA